VIDDESSFFLLMLLPPSSTGVALAELLSQVMDGSVAGMEWLGCKRMTGGESRNSAPRERQNGNHSKSKGETQY
jgi:hypothetical protein